MMIGYKKLWKLLIDCNLLKKCLMIMVGISQFAIIKLEHNENVNTDIIIKICKALTCDITDICELVKGQSIRNIEASIPGVLCKVWELVLDIENYSAWKNDLSKTEVISDTQFIEYTKDGYPATFTVIVIEPYTRWEFDMENSNMKGHWIGSFTDKGNETEIDFTGVWKPKSGC